MNAAGRRAYLERLEHFGIKLGLDNIRTLLDALGRPQDRFASVLVAGTNGKGSVSAMLARILKEQGVRAGLYTSPHLVRVEERVRVDGTEIAPRDFNRRLEEVRGAIERLIAAGGLPGEATYFEVMTALALRHFARAGVEVAILEVGLGGRFDATNAVDPALSVITTISRDHVEHLGESPAAIAFEKAGILRPGVPVVCGVKSRAAAAVIRERALELGAPYVPVFGPGTAFAAERSGGGFRFRYRRPGDRAEWVLRPSLAGRHQGENAATAVTAALMLGRIRRPISRRAILRGISGADWPGRLEVVSRRPLVILDGAHNAEGALSLAGYVREVLKRPVVLVFGVMRDKDVRRMAGILFPLARRIVATRVPRERSAAPEDIVAAAPRFRDRIAVSPDPRTAWRLARAEAGPGEPILVAGSLFLVGEFKRFLPRPELHISTA